MDGCPKVAMSEVTAMPFVQFSFNTAFSSIVTVAGSGCPLSKGKDRTEQQRRDYGTLKSAFEGGVTAFSSGWRICDSHAYGTR